MSPIKYISETTITLEIEDLRLSFTHENAYCLMLFCLGEALVPGKENVFMLPFTSPFKRKLKGPNFIKDFRSYHGCLFYTAHSSDNLRIVLDTEPEYEVSRSSLLWLLYNKLKSYYGLYLNIPVTGDQPGTRSYYDSIPEVTTYLYPIKDDVTHISIDYGNKKYYLYLAVAEGYCTKPVWVNNNYTDEPINKYDLLNASGVYLASGRNGEDTATFIPGATWLCSQEQRDTSALKLFADKLASPALSFS